MVPVGRVNSASSHAICPTGTQRTRPDSPDMPDPPTERRCAATSFTSNEIHSKYQIFILLLFARHAGCVYYVRVDALTGLYLISLR